MRIKTLVLALCLVIVVMSAAAGTIAYLTATDTVTNTFTVGNIDMTVDETDVDKDGKPVPGATERVEQNEYHLVPGRTYVKDPTVTITKGSDACYVRMMVTINKIAELKAIFGEDFLPEAYVEGWDKAAWPCASIKDNGDNTATYEFRYFEAVDASEATEDVVLDALFEAITVPGEVTGEQLQTISELKIEVVGHAIQRATFEESADAAWAAFDAQMSN